MQYLCFVDGQIGNASKYYLQIGTYLYPLVRNVSPCYRADYGAIFLPNVESGIEGNLFHFNKNSSGIYKYKIIIETIEKWKMLFSSRNIIVGQNLSESRHLEMKLETGLHRILKK